MEAVLGSQEVMEVAKIKSSIQDLIVLDQVDDRRKEAEKNLSADHIDEDEEEDEGHWERGSDIGLFISS